MNRSRRTTAALLDIVQATSSDTGATMQARRDEGGVERVLVTDAASLSLFRTPAYIHTPQTVVQKVIDAAYVLMNCERVTLYLVDSVKQVRMRGEDPREAGLRAAQPPA